MLKFLAPLLMAMATLVPCQQWNSFTATMFVDGANGPPVPMVYPCSRGLPHSLNLQGLPYAPFILYGSPTLLSQGIFIGGPGVVDINPVGYYTLFNGMTNPLFNTGASGFWTANFTLAGSTPLNTTQSYQGLLADASAPTGARLTMATKLVVSPGLTTQAITLGDNDYATYSFPTNGITNFPFYNATFTTMFVSANGYCSFNGADDDFTPTIGEFNSSYPRMAPKWADLHPELGGSINVQTNLADTPPTVTVNWVALPEWANNGANHTFSLKLYSQIGDIELIHGPMSPPVMSYESMTGITRGGGLGPNTGTQKNLSNMFATPIQGAPNENFVECYGNTSMAYYCGSVNNPFDLTGRTVTFYAMGAGATGGYYIGTCTQ